MTKERISNRGAELFGNRRAVPGTVLLSFKLSVGKVGIADVPLYTNEAIAALPILDPSVLFSDYLARYLEYVDLLPNADRAAMGNTLNLRKLRSIEIPVPPLPEQRRIASILDQADNLRAKRKDALAALEQLGDSLFDDLVDDKARASAVALSSITSRITDGTHQAPKWSNEGVPFLFVSNMVTGRIDYETERFVSEATYRELTKSAPIEVGDILYTAVGSYGIPVVVETPKQFIFQRHLAHIKPINALVDSLYLRATLRSDFVARQADRVARGVAQKTVTLGELAKFRIPLIALASQLCFAERTREMEGQRTKMVAHLEKLDELFASLQHRAFRGEL